MPNHPKSNAFGYHFEDGYIVLTQIGQQMRKASPSNEFPKF